MVGRMERLEGTFSWGRGQRREYRVQSGECGECGECGEQNRVQGRVENVDHLEVHNLEFCVRISNAKLKTKNLPE